MLPTNLDWEAYGKHLKPVGRFFEEHPGARDGVPPARRLGAFAMPKAHGCFGSGMAPGNRRRRPIFRVVVRTKRFPGGIELVAVVNHGSDRLFRQP